MVWGTELRCAVEEGELCLDLDAVQIVPVGDGRFRDERDRVWERKMELRGVPFGDSEERDFALMELEGAEQTGQVFFGPMPEPWDSFLAFGESMVVTQLSPENSEIDCAPEELEGCLATCHRRDADKVFFGGWSESELGGTTPAVCGLSNVFQRMFGKLKAAAVVASRRQAAKKAIAAKKKAGAASKPKKPAAAKKAKKPKAKKGKSKRAKKGTSKRRKKTKGSDEDEDDALSEEEESVAEEEEPEEDEDPEEEEEEPIDEEAELSEIEEEDDEQIELFEMEESDEDEGDEDPDSEEEEEEDEDGDEEESDDGVQDETEEKPNVADQKRFKVPAPRPPKSSLDARQKTSPRKSASRELDARNSSDPFFSVAVEPLAMEIVEPYRCQVRSRILRTVRPYESFAPHETLRRVRAWNSAIECTGPVRAVKPFSVRLSLGTICGVTPTQ